MIWAVVVILLLLSLWWRPEFYETMGVYGTRRTLDTRVPGELPVLPWSSEDSVVSPSLTEIQRSQIQGSEAVNLLQWDNQYHLLPTHRVDVS